MPIYAAIGPTIQASNERADYPAKYSAVEEANIGTIYSAI